MGYCWICYIANDDDDPGWCFIFTSRKEAIEEMKHRKYQKVAEYDEGDSMLGVSYYSNHEEKLGEREYILVKAWAVYHGA